MISAPVLGFDLARMSGGAEVAQVVACALRLDEQGLLSLATVARHHSEAAPTATQADDQLDRLQAWLDLSMATAATSPGQGNLAGLSHTMITALTQPAGSEQPTEPGSETGEDEAPPADKLAATIARRDAEHCAIAAVLEQAPLGSLDALLRCLREEILDWAPALLAQRSPLEAGLLESGVTIICDAAAAAYTHDVLPADAYSTLWSPWREAYEQLDVRYRGQPAAGAALFAVQGSAQTGVSLNPQVRYLLDRLAQVNPAQVEQVAQASARWRFRDPSWSTAVHDASWAVSLSERTREAALAQMRLVQICRHVNWPIAALAGGDWNTISGAIHALVVRDLVGSETLHRLIAACEEVFGPLSTQGEGQAA